MAVIVERVEIARAVVEPAIAGDVERAVAGDDLDRVEPERKRRRPLHAVPAGAVVERVVLEARMIELDDRMIRERVRDVEHLLRRAVDDRLGRWPAAVGLAAIDGHRIDADVQRLGGELVRGDRRDGIVEVKLGDLGVEIAVRVVIGEPDHLDPGGDLRDHALRVRHVRIVGRVGVDVEIGGERAVRRPRALERDRELDAAAVGGEIDLALPAFVLDAAPRPHLVAAVRDARRRHAGVVTDRDLADAVRQHEPVPRCEHPGCDRARRRQPWRWP